MNCVHGVRLDKDCRYCALSTREQVLLERVPLTVQPKSYTEDEKIVAEALVWAFEQRPGWQAKISAAIRHTPQELLEAVR